MTTKTNQDISLLPQNSGNNNTKEENNGEEEEVFSNAVQLVYSCTLPMVLKVVIELGILQTIHQQGNSSGLSAAEIANRIQIQNPDAPSMVDRMLRLLETYSVVRCTVVDTTDGGVERRYSPSQVTKLLVPDDDSMSLAAMLNLQVDKVYLESWNMLKEVVSGGGVPFNKVHGMNIFDYSGEDPRFNEVFNNAMYQTTTLVIKKMMDKYKGFENIEQLVDVGGGLGHCLRVITSQYRNIKGINFDLPHVIHNALPCPGVEHVSGDMFESIPEGDAIFLKWILHDWSDEHCLKLLQNCYKALWKNGKVIIVEAMITDEPTSPNSDRVITLLDIDMLRLTVGGKERTKQEFEALAKAAGFANVKFDCCVYNYWFMELYK